MQHVESDWVRDIQADAPTESAGERSIPNLALRKPLQSEAGGRA